jgi:predicted rRNA methylase
VADRPRNPRPGGPRAGGGGGFKPRDGDRPKRDFNDRPQRDFSDRPRRDFGDRPRRDFADRPKRDFGDRPKRDFGDRPKRDFADRPRPSYGDGPRRDFGDRPRPSYGDQPRRDFGDRPRREDGDRPRPSYSDRPRRDFGDRPRRDFTDRPQRYQGPGPRPEPHFSDRPQRGFGRPVRSFDSRRARTTQADDTSGLFGEGEELIAGKRPVEEAFAARREAIRLLIVPERRAALDALAIHATTLRIPVVEVEGGSLTAIAGFDGHQGVALVVKPRQHADVDTILAHARERNSAPFVLILDSLEDPQNFGTLLRSAEACGVDGVIYPTHRAAPLSAAAIKASAGATEHLLLAPVDDLAGMLADLHAQGLRIVGADEDASLSYSEADLRGPLAIVVGSEGKGMTASVKRRLDLTVRIPMRGRIESLNAAVAGSILLFAAAQQRPIAAPDEATQMESKPTRKAPAKKSVAKPRRTTIHKVDASAMDEDVLPQE